MMTDEKIETSSKLEVVVFCIENVASRLGADAKHVYQAFTEKSDILNGYIVPEYEALHTQSWEYIVEDLLDVMEEKGVKLHSLSIAKHSDMTANPILLQKKYSRVIECFAKQQGISLDAALDFFYHSEVYPLIRDGVSDMHCISDAYLAEELGQEYANKAPDSAEKVPDTMERLPENEQEQQVYKYVLETGSITTARTMELLGVKQRRARTVLSNMIESDYLRKEGAARSTIYVKNTEGR